MHQRDQEVLQQLKTIDPSKLPQADRLNYVLFRKQYEMKVEGFTHRWHLLPIDQWSAIQNQSQLLNTLRFDTVQDYEDWIARMEKFPAYVDQILSLMKEGLRTGRLHPNAVMKRVPRQVAQHIVDDPEKCDFFRPFQRLPKEIPPAERERLGRRAKEVIAGSVVPAYRTMLTFLEKEYLPACGDDVGVGNWKGGRELYAYRVRSFTTTNLTPDEVHAIGLREVSRVRDHMEQLMKQVGFKGTLTEFLAQLRTNPKFSFATGDQALDACRAACKQAESQLPRLFGRLPRTPYLIEPLPAGIAADAPVAFYRRPSKDGRPGAFLVNVHKGNMVPRYSVEALCLHEAVPGHHMQIALEIEREDLPNFQRFPRLGGVLYSAYIEGWGLYCEGLGEDLGLYRDSYARLDRLSFDMLRSVRLVVDTGMHVKGWTREKALEYAVSQCAEPRDALANEIDRYIAFPGQALAYKIGELRILEIRDKAKRELGNRFDLKSFHDIVLESGAVPLDVLDDLVAGWIAKQRKR